jgi:putative transposase
MSRRTTEFASGEYYHVYNRGCNREDIFREEDNYSYLERLIGESLKKCQVSMVAYCLMPNHFHFLMRQESEVAISEVIHEVFNRYVKAFNKRYGRTGTLFEERFKVRHVDNPDYLVHLCRYIHRNPVEAGIVEEVGSWKHSDYMEWASGQKNSDLVSDLFSSPLEYARFVTEYHPTSEVETALEDYLMD